MAGQYAKLEDAQVQKYLKNVNEKASNLKGLANSFGAVVYRDVIDHFTKEMGPLSKWKEWSPSYRKQLKRQGRAGNKILQYSGKLRQSFVPSFFRTQKNKIIWFNPAKTKGGFPYAAAHDTGGPKLPQREFMWVSDKTLEVLAKISLDFID
jgi:phage gpG-like protein